MNKQINALKLALEALDQLTNAADTFSVSGVYFNEGVWAKKCLSDAYFAITTIEQALAQPEQEPVAWMIWLRGHAGTFAIKREAQLEFQRRNEKYPDPDRKLLPIYTTQPPVAEPHKHKQLTDEE